MKLKWFLEGGDDFEAAKFVEIAEAIFANDMPRARVALEELRIAGGHAVAELLIRARQRADAKAAAAPARKKAA